MEKYIKNEIEVGQQKFIRYFTKLELENLTFVEPFFYVYQVATNKIGSSMTDSEFKDYCVFGMQREFNILLRLYFKLPDKNFLKLGNVRKTLIRFSIFEKAFEKQTDLMNIDTPQLPAQELIVKLFKKLRLVFDKASGTSGSKQIIVKSFNYSNLKNHAWQYKVIKYLQHEASGLNEYILTLLLHGSFATEDYHPEYSDLDTLLVLKNQVLEDSVKLRQFKSKLLPLSSLFFKIDPAAHHQFMIVNELDLKFFPTQIFPLVLFENSLVLAGEKEFSLDTVDEPQRHISQLFDMHYYFRSKIIQQKFSQNMVNWKNDLSHIMLFPSLLLQTKDIETYKRDSFALAKEKFPNLDFSIIDQVSKLRMDWRQLNLLKFLPNGLIANNFRLGNKIVSIHRRLANKNNMPSPDKIKTFTEQAHDFCETSLNKVLNNINTHK